MDNNRPKPASVARTLEPPDEKSGNCIPVEGTSCNTTHMLMSTWKPIRTVIGTILISALCVGNIVLSDQLFLRIVVIIFVVSVSVILYREIVGICCGYIKTYIRNRKK